MRSAFLVEKNWFSYSSDYRFLIDFPDQVRNVPAVLEWGIANGTCDLNPICSTDAYCSKNGTEDSYNCYCKKGYSVNPYLHHGCQGIGVGVGLLFLVLASLWTYRVVKRNKNIKLKEKFFKQNGGLLLQQQISSNEGSVEKTKIFTAKELEKATDNYNENRILGQGGHGTVYKGMLTDGRIVAVKKSKIVDEGQIEQFINEIKWLFDHIHDQSEEFLLSWNDRLRIAAEVAGAVAYLHSAASIPIYHRDIKSTNILLMTNIEQKWQTLELQEYFQPSQFTEKSDVYSFGVVLVELLTSQKPISSIRSQEERSLAVHFILSVKENRLFDILDAKVVTKGGKEELIIVSNLAKRCLNLNRKKRPTMKEVAMDPEGMRMYQGKLPVQQNHQEVEHYITETSGSWDTFSTSTGYASLENSAASPLATKPLLLNSSC
ncbi:hypothetical protein HHK36_009016 [Tetracentron sinense]|uniref:Protein kinase domain-containing protein n=1 Tax=Tetracentron sinense TaxID=13715 RepID=A0A834ZHZ8_TETSI|nr:hypothetical protein HHK36_009016 [Tetracentron sinense]